MKRGVMEKLRKEVRVVFEEAALRDITAGRVIRRSCSGEMALEEALALAVVELVERNEALVREVSRQMALSSYPMVCVN